MEIPERVVRHEITFGQRHGPYHGSLALSEVVHCDNEVEGHFGAAHWITCPGDNAKPIQMLAAKDATFRKPVDLGKMASVDLIDLLKSDNRWQRQKHTDGDAPLAACLDPKDKPFV